MKLGYRLILLFVFVVPMTGLPVFAQKTGNARHSGYDKGLTSAARMFLSAWLVKRDVRKAMLSVASRPVLSQKCDLPKNMHKVPSSATVRRNLLRQEFSSAFKVFPKYEALKSAVGPTDIPEADWLKIEATDAFQILQIKTGEKGYLMCKFDENETGEYRRTLWRPNVRYIGFKLKNIKDFPDIHNWISAWAKENGKWKLIAIGLLED